MQKYWNVGVGDDDQVDYEREGMIEDASNEEMNEGDVNEDNNVFIRSDKRENTFNLHRHLPWLNRLGKACPSPSLSSLNVQSQVFNDLNLDKIQAQLSFFRLKTPVFIQKLKALSKV